LGYNDSIKRMRHVLIAFFLISGFVQASCADGAPRVPEDIRSLVPKIIAAYGGKEVLEGLKRVYAEGHIEALMRQDNGSYKVYLERPGKLRVEVKYQRSSETRILNGDSGYRGKDGSPLSRASGDSLLAMVYQYKHSDLPYGLLKGAYSISRKGEEDLNGRQVEVLHLTDREGPPMDIYVDTRTFLIVKVTGYFRMAGGSTALSAEFSDFRKVGGTVFPFRIANFAGGFKIAETVMKTYKINPPMADSLFAP
jgi:outer membrane lipoprotein-sorting protein